MKASAKLLTLPLLLMATTGAAFAQSFSGNPATDALWTSDGLSSSAGNLMLNAGNSAAFSANVYSTAFSLAPGSTLLGALGVTQGWNAGDTIVGVGGVFAATGNGSLTYDTANNTVNLHLVVKYGAPTATWNLAGNGPPTPPANGAGSLNFGGTGSILLGTFAETIGPSTGIVTPTDAPTILNGTQLTLAGGGNEGQVMTIWSGNTIVGFESFLDLNKLNSEDANANVQLGDKFVLDLQQGTGAFQDSLGTLPSSLAVPEPTTLTLLTGALLIFVAVRIPRVLRKRQSVK